MALSTTQAGYLSLAGRVPGLFEESPKVDHLMDVLPFVPVNGHELDITKVTSGNMATSAFIAAAGVPTENSATPSSPAAYPIKRIAGDVIVNSLVQDIYSSLNDQAQIQVDAKIRAARYILGEKLITGNTGGAPEEFNGLDNLVAAGQKTGAANNAADGGTLALPDVDRLINLIKVGNGRPDFLLCNTTGRAKYLSACYTEDITPQFVKTPWFAEPVLAHGGIPILLSDHILNNYTKGSGTNLTRMWAITLGYARGLTGIYPARSGDAMVKVTRIVLEGTDQETYRVVWNVGLALFAETAIALLEGIETT